MWFRGKGRPDVVGRENAKRVSAEQAAYLAEGFYIVVEASKQYLVGEEYPHIDVRRLENSPNRIHPLTIREFIMVRFLGIKLRVDKQWSSMAVPYWNKGKKEWITTEISWWDRIKAFCRGQRLYVRTTATRSSSTMKIIDGVEERLNDEERKGSKWVRRMLRNLGAK